MKSIDARKSIQRILGVRDDGDFGPKTDGAYNRLGVARDDAEWPSVDSRAFTGLTDELRAEYRNLYDTMEYGWTLDNDDEPGLEAIYQGLRVEFTNVLAAIRSNQSRYQTIAAKAGGSIPWYFIAIIHNLECGLSFKKHLHNGDPLTTRTVQVPRGRPASGSPPFSFEDSSVDALTMPGKEFDRETDWSIPALLYKLEGFNGYGYRKYHPEVKSPYLWSGSRHYTRGKYVADGVWSSTAVSKQLGSALLLKALRG